MRHARSAATPKIETCNKVSLASRDLPWRIEMIPVQSLKSAPRNARTHSKKQIKQIAEPMKRFGVTNPIIADDAGQIVAGHGRAEAAKLIGLRFFPVIRLSNLSDAEIRACRLADNKLADNAKWDREILALEIEELQIALPEIGLDLEITGFNPGEIDTLLTDFAGQRPNPSDEIPDLESVVVARTGDLFILGNHRIVVGDARNEETYTRLMKSETAEMAFLDPPYNVKNRRPCWRSRPHQASGISIRVRGNDL
jgi:hypothetical protein